MIAAVGRYNDFLTSSLGLVLMRRVNSEVAYFLIIATRFMELMSIPAQFTMIVAMVVKSVVVSQK